MADDVTRRPAAGGEAAAQRRFAPAWLASPAFASPALADAARLFSRLLDAFVEQIEPLVARFRSDARWIAVVDEAGGIALYEARPGQPSVRLPEDAVTARGGAHRAAGGAVELRLPPDQVLHRTLQLPPASRDFLQPIIEHRLERLTPWSPSRVLYGFRVLGDAGVSGDAGVLGEAGADGSMSVAFAATSLDVATEAERRLEALGLAPTALGPATETIDAPLGIDLYRGARSGSRAGLRRRVKLGLSATAAVLGLALVGSFWLVQASEERLRTVEERLGALRGRLAAGGGAGAEQARGRTRALIEAKRPDTSIVVLIDGLSAALPWNTALRELDIDAGKVRLNGRSRDAPALIALLEAEEALARVQFAAPVVRDADNLDDFEITASRVVKGREAGDGGR